MKELVLVNPTDFIVVMALALFVVMVGLISWKLDMGYVVIAMSSVLFIGFVVVMMAFHFGGQPRIHVAQVTDATELPAGYHLVGQRTDGSYILESVPQ